MALVLGWGPPTSESYDGKSAYLQRAIVLNHGLSLRDSLLIASDSLLLAADDPRAPFAGLQSVRLLEAASRRFPEDPEIWYQLGEARSHYLGGLSSPGPALEAFERVIALDSGFAPAYEHTIQLAVNLGRPEQAQRFAEAYATLDSTGHGAAPARLAALFLRRRPADSVEVANAIASASAGVLFRTGFDLRTWPESAETAVQLLRRLAEAHPGGPGAEPWVTDTLMQKQYLASALMVRGHLREAMEVDRELIEHPERSQFSAFMDPFLELGLLGILPDSLVRATFDRALVAGRAWESDPAFGQRRSMRGLPWWLAQRDSTKLRRFAARARTVERAPDDMNQSIRARYLGAASAAYLSLVHGDSAGAERMFRAIPDSLCLVCTCFYEKVTLARLIASRGDLREAKDLLDKWIETGGEQHVSKILATLERGRLAEALGNAPAATADYQFVTEVWQHADSELQPYVREASDGLRRLSEER
jgi:serine/threonine-protein kinase